MIGVDDRSMPQTNRVERLSHHVENLDDVIVCRAVTDDHQPVLAVLAGEQIASTWMEAQAE